MLSVEDRTAVLVPTMPFHRLKIAQYIDQAKKRKLFKDEYITAVADSIDDLYYFYVEKGLLRCIFTKITGEPVTLCYRHAGNAFSAEFNGVASIGDYKMRWIALADTIVFGFSQRQLFDIAKEDPEIFYEYILVCHMALGQMGHRISSIGVPSSMDRIVFWLVKLCAIHTPDENGIYTIPAIITNQQIAELLHMHVTTCSRLFNVLEANSIVSRRRNEIIVYDLEKLLQFFVSDSMNKTDEA